MPDLGPHQFDIPVSDSYPANNPADPSDDLKVSVEVPVTIHWNLGRGEQTGSGFAVWG